MSLFDFAFIHKRRDQIALFQAIYERDLQRIQQLVADGLDLNFAREGFSPLCRAVAQKNSPQDTIIVDILIAHGASPRGPGNDCFSESLLATEITT